MKDEAASPGFRFTLEEISGSLGDLGTFLPLTLGSIAQCGLSPAPVFFFAGLWNVVTGFLFRLPIPVQPMKAIAAVAIAAAGMAETSGTRTPTGFPSTPSTPLKPVPCGGVAVLFSHRRPD